MEFHERIILILTITLVVLVLGFGTAAVIRPEFAASGWGMAGALLGPVTGALTLIITTYAVKKKDDDPGKGADK